MSSFLNELCSFYERMTENPDSGMPPDGMTSERISFALVINAAGRLVREEDLRDSKGKAMRCFVPASVKRTGNALPFFLWDKTDFVLGVSGKNMSEMTITAKYFSAFKEFHKRLLNGCHIPQAEALLAFLGAWTPEQFAALDMREAMLGQNVVFKLDGEDRFLHEAPELKNVWARALRGDGEDAGVKGICLITGEPAPIARIHPAIKDVKGARSSGAALISFKPPAFASYGKKQSYNAPVSESAARAYTTALNYLLQREHGQKVQVGDTSLVFWAEQSNPAEKVVCRFLDLTPPEVKKAAHQDKEQQAKAKQDQAQIDRIKGILLALRRGESLNEADKSLKGGARFFVLGLAPNATRISVRFWLEETLEELLKHLARWYTDLDIERQFPDSDPEFPPLWLLLARSLAALGKSENVPPQLAGQLARCVLTGSRFPASVLACLLQRIHADKKMDYFRAALIKAALCRNYFTPEEGLSMQTLNENEQNIGYRLGRAFALLEKAQKDALGKDVNAPLSERYLGAASSTPLLVFGRLLVLFQHHLIKLRKKPGKENYEAWFKQRMGGILSTVNDAPATLSLADQLRFMLGYYHEMNALYKKKANAAGDAEIDGNAESSMNPEAAE